jgi:predicted ATP-grasp superfamily ATP-dependent carboligase
MNIDVVIVGGSANALGILRSLAPYAKCLVLLDDKKLPAYHSLFGKKILVESTKDEHIIDALIKLGSHFKAQPVLFLSEEKTVEQVSLHRDKISSMYFFNMAEHKQIVALQSKIGFQKLAEKFNSPIPQAIAIEKTSDIKQINKLTFPCVFKPLYQDSAYAKQFKKAYKVEHIEQIESLYVDISPIMPNMLAQEWLHGKDSDIYFCLAYFDKNSQLVSSFSGRKLRSWPLNIGGTASCTNAPKQHQELSDITSTFASNISFTGLMGMEFKFDSYRDGFYMIEPTVGRTDYQHEIATLSGHNLLLQMYRHISKAEVPSYKLNHAAVIWRDEIADANALANGGDKTEPKAAKHYNAIKRGNDIRPYLVSLIARIITRIKKFPYRSI